jgi:hypothetical protein
MPSSHNPKRIGERAECAFLWQAYEHGLLVSQPFGDSAPYDFIVDNRGPGRSGIWRIQVKCSTRLNHSGYKISAHHLYHQPYHPDEVDFFAAWIVPLDLWYIIPVAKVHPRRNVALYPHVEGSCGKYEPYREAWHLLVSGL